MTPETILITSRFAAPMIAPLLRDAGIVVTGGRIVAVGSVRDLPGPQRVDRTLDLGDAIILPGLVNAHVHLELSACEAGSPPQGHFVDWILSIRERMRLNDENLAEVVTHSTSVGLEQCRRFGVTAVGDISQHNHITRPLLRDASIRCVSYGEVLGIGGLRSRYDVFLPRATDRSHESETLQVGLTPHAPYTVDVQQYRQCLQLAREGHFPLATHLAESAEETEFLRHHNGPFRDVLDRLGLWRDDISSFDGTPVQLAHAIGLLDYPTLLAHVNYCDDHGMELLSRGRASVVYCPRTHAYFGHPPHRWREMLARGINLALGTDSSASSPDLNLVDDLRLLRRIAPDLPAATLWELATTRAARAVGMQDQVGALAPGMRADFAVFPVETNERDPLESILQESRLPQTWFAGREFAVRHTPGSGPASRD